jgi:hypothetical protein
MEAGTQQSPLTYLVEPPPRRPTAQRSPFGLREFLFLMVAVAVICLLAWIVMFAE